MTGSFGLPGKPSSADAGLGRRESGAFLLGSRRGVRRRIERFVYYDDLDPHALDSGIVDLDGAAFGALWSLCRSTGLSVVADVHTHPDRAFFSGTDRANPMIAELGHLALVLPTYAQAPFSRRAMKGRGLSSSTSVRTPAATTHGATSPDPGSTSTSDRYDSHPSLSPDTLHRTAKAFADRRRGVHRGGLRPPGRAPACRLHRADRRAHARRSGHAP